MKRLLLVVAVVGLIALIAKRRTADRSEWQGLTEEQAREKLNNRFPGKMPDDKREMVTEKIVTKMRNKGVIIDLNDEDTPSDQSETAEAPA